VQYRTSTDGVTYGSYGNTQDISSGTYAYNNLTPALFYQFRTYANNPAGASAATVSSPLFVSAGGRRWDGTAWVASTTSKRWNGSAWVDLTVAKRWNGTAWVANSAPPSTPQIISVTDASTGDAYTSTGGKLEGLEYRIKSTDSLARKIEGDAKAEKHGGSLESAANDISDASRYTMTFPEENYTGSVQDALKQLEDYGYEVKAKNFWQKGDDYQGINVKLKAKNGSIIELQFHTPSSLATKEKKLHSIYEKYREEKDLNKKYTFWNEMVSVSDSIPVPAGYDKLLNVGVPSKHNFNE
jgi:hypothetical protein